MSVVVLCNYITSLTSSRQPSDCPWLAYMTLCAEEMFEEEEEIWKTLLLQLKKDPKASVDSALKVSGMTVWGDCVGVAVPPHLTNVQPHLSRPTLTSHTSHPHLSHMSHPHLSHVPPSPLTRPTLTSHTSHPHLSHTSHPHLSHVPPSPLTRPTLTSHTSHPHLSHTSHPHLSHVPPSPLTHVPPS